MENMGIVDQIRNDRKKDLENLCSAKFNESQIKMIQKIFDQLDSVPKINDFFNLIVEPMKFGLRFDFAPEEFGHRAQIAILEKDRDLSFKLRERERERRERDKSLINTLILGDNQDALANLLITHRGRIDLIYIDPPYNTENATLSYRDKFAKNAWLSMIKERLQIAQQLLSKDGVIFVSIDDNMQAYLKVLMDEIFGEENFVGTIIHNKLNAQNDAINIQKNHDYIHVFSKAQISKMLKVFSENERKILTDKNGKPYIRISGITTGGAGGVLSERKKLGWTIYYNPSTKEKIGVMDYNPDDVSKTSDESIYRDNTPLIERGFYPIRPPKKLNSLGCWTWSLDKFNNEKDMIDIYESKGKYIVSKIKYLGEDYKNISPLKSVLNVSSSSGTKQLTSIFGEKVEFKNPKSLDLIKEIICSYQNKNAIILDFYAGSGTTGEAVLELNREDGGNRKFILCTLDEDKKNNIGTKICYERLYRINYGVGTNSEQMPEWLKKHQPYNDDLNVYRIKYLDVQPNNAHPFQNFDSTPYTELNPYLSLNSSEDFYEKFYELSLKNWWLQNE